jgi:hypothetical protein
MGLMAHQARWLFLVSLLLCTPVQAERAAPSIEAFRQAEKLMYQAENLRQLQLPLLKQRAVRNIQQVYGALQRAGIRVHPEVPHSFESTREYTLVRQVGEMLRGAPKGTPAYTLRKQAMGRALELHRSLLKMPPQVLAYTSENQGQVALAINLDNSFYADADRLLAITAHEQQHVRDLQRTLRLEELVAHPELS